MLPTARQLFVAVLVCLLVVPASTFGAVNGSPKLDFTVADNTVTPGESTQLEVTLLNEGDIDTGSTQNPALSEEVTTARAVNATLDADDAPVEVKTGSRGLGNLPKGQSATLPYDIVVDEDAESGTYEMELTVEYRYTSVIGERNGARNEATEIRTFDVTIEVEDRARFEVVSTETDARVGSTGTTSVTMQNVGSEAANDTTVTLESANTDLSFSGAGSTSRFVDNWDAGETRTLEYQVTAAETAKQQRYAFTATASFTDDDGVTHQSAEHALSVTPRPKQQFQARITDHDVSIGDTGTVDVTLQNVGDSPVSEATVTLDSQSRYVAFGNSSSATRYVGEWAAGTNQTVRFDATARDGAETRSYALDATVSYEGTNGQTTAEPVSVGLMPQPERTFSISNVSNTLRVGEEGTVRGTITNEGQTTARNVVVQFDPDSSNVNPVSKRYAVGTLGPGDSETVAFDASVANAASEGPRQFSFTAEYQNSDDETRTSDDLVTQQQIEPGSDAFALESVNATYARGGGGDLVVRVTNTANETVTDVSAKLFTDEPISSGDKEGFVDELAPGESTTLTFESTVGGDALAKRYPVSVDIQYTDADGDTHVSDSHTVAVQVTEPESDGSGGGFPITLIGVGMIGLVGVGGYLRFWR